MYVHEIGFLDPDFSGQVDGDEVSDGLREVEVGGEAPLPAQHLVEEDAVDHFVRRILGALVRPDIILVKG
jgi:hypothetical protein